MDVLQIEILGIWLEIRDHKLRLEDDRVVERDYQRGQGRRRGASPVQGGIVGGGILGIHIDAILSAQGGGETSLSNAPHYQVGMIEASEGLKGRSRILSGRMEPRKGRTNRRSRRHRQGPIRGFQLRIWTGLGGEIAWMTGLEGMSS